MTYKDLFLLIANIQNNIGDQTTKGQKKLFKIYEKVKPLVDDYQSQIDDLKLDYASTDDKGDLIIDEKGGYKYTKDQLKAFNKEFKSLENKEIEFSKIEIVNPSGLEEFNFLSKWVSGIEFNEIEIEEEL